MKKNFLKTFLFCLIMIDQSYAQGWSQKKSEGYFKLGFNAISANSFYSPDGDKTQITTTGIYTSSLYAEYGLLKHLTLVAYVPFFVRNTLNKIQYRQSGRIEPGDQQNAFGDTDIALKYGWLQNKALVFSTTLLFGLPLGNNAGGVSGILQSGDGEFNQMIRADISHSFYPTPLFASVYTAFNNRTKGFSDELRYGADVGYTVKNISFIAHVNAVNSFQNGNTISTNNGIFSNNMEYISPAIEVLYETKKGFGLSISYSTALSGKNVLAAPSFGGGIVYKLKKLQN